MNGGGFMTKAHSTEPHNHLSYDIIDLNTAIQNQRYLLLMSVEDCSITEGFGNNYEGGGGSPLNTYDINC